ncbi:MAG: phasin family protein [Nodosilinea sp.]
MAGFTDLVKKTFYLGVGAAAYAGEKATHTLKDIQKLSSNLRDLQQQAQTVVNDLVERGEITAEEAQRLVNQLVNRPGKSPTHPPASAEPRSIEISDNDAESSSLDLASTLRQQVATLGQELDALRQRSKHL